VRDLVVVGGGPAGLATAILAAQAGLATTLVERRWFPVDKPCGEGLMPEGVRALRAMGVRVDESFPFEGIRYVDDGRVAEARFHHGPGLGIRRTVLSQGMVNRAVELGVEVLERSPARDVVANGDRVRISLDSGSLESKWLALANGNGNLLREPPVDRRESFRRYGYRRHYRRRPWSSFVEVHWGRGAEAYVTPVSENEVGLAFLFHEAAPTWESMLARFPALEERLEGCAPNSPLAGAGPMRRRMRSVASPRVALVGDASGYVDALTGDGVALAFECARALVSSLVAGSLAGYDKGHRRTTRRYRVMTELALILTRRPLARRVVVASLGTYPRLFESLLSFSRGSDIE
jgi:flavin-dependent dehydrogenase